jgi:hypothetical protein
MKKMILAAAILGVAGAGIRNVQAGDHEWAIAGKVLTGLAVASVITHAVAPETRVYATVYASPPAPDCRYNYCPPPAPVVTYVRPAPQPMVVYRPRVYVAPPPVRVVRVPVVAPVPVRVVPVPRVIVRPDLHEGYRHGRYHRW